MKSRWLLLVAGLLLAALVLRLLWAGPETKIRRQMDKIASQASRSGQEAPVMAAVRAKGIASAFAEDVEALRLRSSQRVRGRDEIARAVAWARDSYDQAEVHFDELEVELVSGTAAETRAVLRILGRDGQPASEHDGARLRFSWECRAGTWLIVLAEVDERPDEAP